MTRTIVGIDGSDHSIAALQWAVERATGHGDGHGDEVVALFAWSFFDQGHLADGEEPQAHFDVDDAARVLADAIDAAGMTGRVTPRTVQDPAPDALAEFARADDLIVVAARGLGGFKGLLLGSVSLRVLELAPCPVAVIHADGSASTTRTGPIVVGVDGSEPATAALHWAAAEARAHRVPLRIVHAWKWPMFAEIVVPEIYEALQTAADQVVTDAAGDPALEGLTVETEVVNGAAAASLLAHESDATMIVVANRGHGAAARILLGSTSRQVVQHATGPVVVVRRSE